MSKFKKIFLLSLSILIFTGCLNKDNENDEFKTDVIEVSKKPLTSEVNIKTSTFASDIIVDQIIKDRPETYKKTSINNFSQIESLDFDIAIVPAYRVVDLYNNSKGNINLAAITMINNLNIISDKQINSPKDMAGRTIMVTELGDSIDKLIDSKLSFIKNLMRINTESYTSEKDLIKNLTNSEDVIAILQEPYYSKALEERTYYSFDVNEVISMIPSFKRDPNEDFLSEVIIVNKNYLRDNKESFDKFLEEYKNKQDLINDTTVLSQSIINKYDITNEKALEVYDSREKTFIKSDTMVGVFEIYLDKLEGLDKNIFSGERPGDDLYYK